MAESSSSFTELGLPAPILTVLSELGYEAPTPVQARTVPSLLQGNDVLARAPTGTGKTAAFALPILSRIHAQVAAGPATGNSPRVQTLVLTPTRELAIQVAEAFTRYARGLSGIRVMAIYGGQDYSGQLRALSRGVQVVVGTPGRVTDHIKRGTLKLDGLQTLVLDEADEMLRMGFVDEVEWILDQTPPERQMALFSATMPPQIRRIARKHLKEAEEVGIEGSKTSATRIRQRVWTVGGLHKLDALTRILEVEPLDAMLVFVRTRSLTVELSEKLSARGFAVSAMNGDMAQKERERQVDKLRNGSLDILVATDVAARGLDVARVSHVINYDAPGDTEAYVHRIGRTGRAGRSGDAILFLAARERRLLGALERATGQRIEPMTLPSVDEVNAHRIARFSQGIDEVVDSGHLELFERIVNDYARERDLPHDVVAAALAKLSFDALGMRIDAPERTRKARQKHERDTGKTKPRADAAPPSGRAEKPDSARTVQATGDEAFGSRTNKAAGRPPAETIQPESIAMERFRVEVGSEHGAAASNLVGAIANEADIDARFIGRVDIRDNYSIVELPEGMPKFMLKALKRVWVCGRQLSMIREHDSSDRRVESRADASNSASRRSVAPESKTHSGQSMPAGPSRRRKSGKAHRKGHKQKAH